MSALPFENGACGPRRPECVVMPPGSSWSVDAGFSLRSFDYTKQWEYVAELSRRHEYGLDRQYRREEAAVADFRRFEGYFRGFLDAMGWLLRRMVPLTVFAVQETDRQRYWLVDARRNRITGVDDDSDGSIVITVHALVINDCTRKRMFSVWTPSKRLRIRTRNVPLWQVEALFLLFDLYEGNGLPLWRNLAPRTLAIWLRRWREPVSIVRAAIGVAITRNIRSVADLYRRSSARGRREERARR